MKPILLIALCLASPAAGQFQAKTDDHGVWIIDAGRPVLFYQRASKSKDGKYARANYVHPLNNLDGETLTEDFPADHPHHRGVFWAWHQVTIAGKPIGDPWALKDVDWNVRHVQTAGTDQAFALRTTVDWLSPLWKDNGGKMKPYLRERTEIVVHRAEATHRFVDFTIRLLALESELRIGGAEIPMRGYGGFSPRLKLPKDVRFLSPKGAIEPIADQMAPSPWIDVSATFAEQGVSGVAMLVHPANPGYPQHWILRRRNSMQNAVWPGATPVLMPTETPLTLRYRLVIHRGKGDTNTIDEWQSNFAKLALPTSAEERSLAALIRWGGRIEHDETEPVKSIIQADLDRTAIDDRGLADLAGLARLRKLYLNSTQVTDAGLKSLAPLKGLRTLDLRNTKTADPGLGELAKLPELDTLYINSTQVSDAGLPAGTLASLRILNLRDTRVTDAGLHELSRLRNLETLNLTSNRVTDAGLKTLAPLRQLQTLYLNFTPITDAGVRHLLVFPKLHTLNLRGTKVTDEGLKGVGSLSEMRSLYLNGIGMTDAGCKELAQLRKLQHLILEETPISDAGLKELANLRELEWLNLGGTKVTDASISSLAALRQLKYLDLTGTRISPEGVKKLTALLPGCEITR